MKKNKIRLFVLSTLFIGLVSLTIVFSFYASPSPTELTYSSELGVYDLSPNGERGGRSIPASCESGYIHGNGLSLGLPGENECWNYQNCSMSATPSNPRAGQNVSLNWTPAMAATVYVDGVSIGWPYYSGVMVNPGGAGTHRLSVYIADDHNSTTYTCGMDIEVADLSASCAADRTTSYVNQPVTWTASVSGGVAPYTYTWTRGNGAALGTGNPLVFTYTEVGPKYAKVLVTDANGDTSAVTQCSNFVTVSEPTQPDLISSNITKSGGGTTITTNETVTFTATAGNQTAVNAGAFNDSFAYGYGGSGGSFTPITTINVASLAGNTSRTDTSSSIAFATPGTVTVRHCVDIENSVPETNDSNNCSYQDFVVGSTITASCSASPNPAEEGDSVTWSASVSGGTSPYSYQWQGTDSLSGSGSSVSKTYSSQGTKSGQVKVTDSLGRTSGWVNCADLVVVDDPSYCLTEIRGRVIGDTAWSTNSVEISGTEEVEFEWTVSGLGVDYFTLGRSAPGPYEEIVRDISAPFNGSTQDITEPAVEGESFFFSAQCFTSTESNGAAIRVTRSETLAPPTITVDPDRVRQGETTNLTGNLNGHSGCTITGGTTNIAVPDGTNAFSYTSGAIMGETIITLDCTLGEASDTVYIVPSIEHF